MQETPLSGKVQSATPLAKAIRVRSSVMNPLLWLTGVTFPTSLAFAYLFREHVVVMSLLVGVAIASFLLSAAAFAYFAVKDPTRLQSEPFQRWLAWFQATQGKSGPIQIDPGTHLPTQNPQLPVHPPAHPGAP